MILTLENLVSLNIVSVYAVEEEAAWISSSFKYRTDVQFVNKTTNQRIRKMQFNECKETNRLTSYQLRSLKFFEPTLR